MIDWEPLLASAKRIRLSGTLCRLVESQEQVATNQLVSSLERQSVLEDMLESTKPPLPDGAAGLHYLLHTPFRYPPLPFGSRFGGRHEPSLFYGSVETTTCLAEAAYYRFLFWYGMAESPTGKIDSQHTLFGARYATRAGLRLQSAPFEQHQQVLTAPQDYRPTQALGAAMRGAGIEAFHFISARDPQHGINVALYTPKAFSEPLPVFQDAWLCEVTAQHVRFHAAHTHALHEFAVEIFQVEGVLAAPG